MHFISTSDNKLKQNRFLHRGELAYNIGSLVFGAGIALLAVGISIAIIFKIHYGSEPEIILISIFFTSLGVSLIPFGLNMMMRQTKYGYPIVCTSLFMSLLAIFIFTFTYPHSWFYPLISYTLVLYVFGFLTMVGNAFINVVLRMIEGNSESIELEERKIKSYTDEEIKKDIEGSLRNSTEIIASELQFKIDGTDNIKLGKAFNSNCSTIVRVRDDINEAKYLGQTISPGETEKWGSVGIEKDSMLLANALKEKTIKKGRFYTFIEKFIRRIKRLTYIMR